MARKAGGRPEIAWTMRPGFFRLNSQHEPPLILIPPVAQSLTYHSQFLCRCRFTQPDDSGGVTLLRGYFADATPIEFF